MEQQAVSQEDRNLGLVAHLLGIFTWFVGALVIWLVKKDSAYVEDQAKEALNFQITVTFGYLGSMVLAMLTLGLLGGLGIAVWALNAIFCILATVGASRGERYRYPVCIRLIK